ncbi:allergen Tab y 5.0101 [Drosophila novamexicana]|uniref:allergen Tab y 5.0101 n=1 Tax=Drosophila novamexicana TaxID=47314 RepID=UPI0011E607EF|nr:allergen Tab y 5.0101 [Drosophila novamexicana]
MKYNLLLPPMLLLMLDLAIGDNCDMQQHCPSGTTHVVCLNKKTFGKECGVMTHEIIPVNGALRQNLLQHVNMMRNMMASGLFNLKAAARMPILSWDSYLENTTHMLAYHCTHSKLCSNSDTYNFVSTVLFSGTIKRSAKLSKEITRVFLALWFNDLLGCTMNANNVIVPMFEGSCVGHYIPLIQDYGDRIGCAIRLSKDEKNKKTALANLICNLSRANVNGMPHYEVDEVPGSRCTAGRDRIYQFLCSAEEVVDYNFVPPPPPPAVAAPCQKTNYLEDEKTYPLEMLAAEKKLKELREKEYVEEEPKEPKNEEEKKEEAGAMEEVKETEKKEEA